MSYFSQFLDTVGDGTGSTNATVDGSTTPVVFKISPSITDVLYISLMTVRIVTVGNLSETKYGDVATLEGGILLEWDATGVDLIDLMGGNPIMTSFEWARVCHEDSIRSGKSASFVWDLRHGEEPLRVFPGGEFRVTIRDNLTSLNEHTFVVQGNRITRPDMS